MLRCRKFGQESKEGALPILNRALYPAPLIYGMGSSVNPNRSRKVLRIFSICFSTFGHDLVSGGDAIELERLGESSFHPYDTIPLSLG